MTGQPIGLPNPATSDEVVEGRSWWKTCCAGCCLGFLAIIALVIMGSRLLAGPGPQRIASIPDSFPAALTLYRPEDAKEIVYYPASSKSRITRLISGPFAWVMSTFRKTPGPAAIGQIASTGSIDAFEKSVAFSISRFANVDRLAIRWSGLDATSDEVLRFYAGSLKQAGIGNAQMRRDANAGLTELTGTGTSLAFSLLLIDDANTFGIDSITVIVEYPSPTLNKP
ncbi:MAG TPA: hypothetical protein VN397_05240 [Candidatus Methylomirabilis sp.]|nr:hypothetical protein [Candidatus Methylomirabilis sp.]